LATFLTVVFAAFAAISISFGYRRGGGSLSVPDATVHSPRSGGVEWPSGPDV
jgi:hypothetical protein